ncbi:hypothetical protein [Pseudomonas helleri]|uniref:hypothetical protein n=1 Tax=Pseudomonas helleri TaxID=1608996 RepID=UPI00242D4509|nr:hypothetical protein [Pseudomonas helleri]
MVSRRQLLKLSALGTATFAAPLAYSASNTTMTHKNGSPLGSPSLKDADDNARSLDLLVCGESPTYMDRRGVQRRSWAGMEGEFSAEQVARKKQFDVFLNSSGFEAPIPYVAGIELIRITQTVTYDKNDYRAKSEALPFTTSDWAADVSKFVLIGDDSLRQELAYSSDPKKMAGMVGVIRTPLALAIDGTVAKSLSQTQVDIWEFSNLVTSRPSPNDFGTWDWTPAFEAARIMLGSLGGGDLTFGTGGVYQARYIRLDRYILLNGRGVNSTELKQLAGSNQDFIKSENFDALTGTGLTVNDPRVPSWMGLKDIRVNGNRYNAKTNVTGNISGVPVKLYGPSMILAGNVLIYDGATGGLYTEDSKSASGVSWRGQEEGKFGNVICRANGGFAGWHCRGPHNCDINSIICCFNDGWNFYSEEGASYGGSFDRIGLLHSYAGGRGVEPNADTGVYIGGIARIDSLVSDGDNVVFQSNELQIDKMRAYNIGGELDGIVIDGDNCSIQDLNGVVWGESVGRTALVVNGNNARINGTLTTNNANNDGVKVRGTGHDIDLTIRNFSGTGRTGLMLESTDSEINGKIRGCETAFDYVSGSDNQVKLSIATTVGQTAVRGLGPRLGDRFNIRCHGNTIGGCKTNLRTAPVAMDITTYTVVTIAHGLLYVPPVSAVRINWLVTEEDSTSWCDAMLRVVKTNEKDIVLGYKLSIAAPVGTKARIGISIDLT